MVSEFYDPESATPLAAGRAIDDEGWHHVAWQWRAADQAHFLHVDGGLVWTARPPVLCDPPVLWLQCGAARDRHGRQSIAV
jgi:hypothetical protein